MWKLIGLLGLILVDPPLSQSYVLEDSDCQTSSILPLQGWLFQGGYEDVLCNSSFSDNMDHETGPLRYSPLESFIFYLSMKQPPGFDVNCPTLFCMSYYLLKMIAAEWMTYLELMYHSIKQYEYSPRNPQPAMEQIALLNADIYALQQWARRCAATAQKIRYVIDFLRYRVIRDEDIEHSLLLTEDYKQIALRIDAYNHRVEALVSNATSLVQTMDSRRSLTETTIISRLSYLALTFIPLTFVASFFSMKDSIAPGGKIFRLYFAVSIPLCILVFLVVRPPASPTGAIKAYISGSGATQKLGV